MLAANLLGPSARTVRTERNGEVIGVTPRSPSNESRGEFFIRVVDEVEGRPAVEQTASLLQLPWCTTRDLGQ